MGAAGGGGGGVAAGGTAGGGGAAGGGAGGGGDAEDGGAGSEAEGSGGGGSEDAVGSGAEVPNSWIIGGKTDGKVFESNNILGKLNSKDPANGEIASDSGRNPKMYEKTTDDIGPSFEILGSISKS